MNSISSSLQHQDRVLLPKDLNCRYEDIKAMDQCVKQILKSEEVDGDGSVNNTADGCVTYAATIEKSGSNVVSDQAELQPEYGSLSQQYISLTDQLRNMPEGMLDTGVDDEHSSVLTPRRLLALPNGKAAGDCFKGFCSFDGSSPDHSSQAGAESFSSFSPSVDADSEYESSNSIYCPEVLKADSGSSRLEERAADTRIVGVEGKLQLANEAQGDGMSMDGGYESYYALLDRTANYERELRLANQELQSSREEITRLKEENAKKASDIDPSLDLEGKLESLCPGYTDYKNKKVKVGKLLKQITELESRFFYSNLKNVALEEELHETRKRLEESKEEAGKLEHEFRYELEREWQSRHEVANLNVTTLEAELLKERTLVSELQDTITMYKSISANQELEVNDLKSVFCAAQAAFNSEKSQLIAEISILSQQYNLQRGRVGEAARITESMRCQIEDYQSEKMEMELTNERLEKHLLAEIEQLRDQLSLSSERVNVLNKSLDASKQKYDKLMVEKDKSIAELQTLNAELRCKDIQIQDIQAQVDHLTSDCRGIVAGLATAQKLNDGLKDRVEELEREVEKERAVSSERAEEKLEAIRQLCLAIEYYRKEYHELREALVGLKHFRIVPS